MDFRTTDSITLSLEILIQGVLSEARESMLLKWSCNDPDEPPNLDTSGLKHLVSLYSSPCSILVNREKQKSR